VYVPAVLSVIARGLAEPDAERPDDEVAVKLVILEPPVALAVNVTEAIFSPPLEMLLKVGACGTVVAVTELEAEEAEDVPCASAAVTANV
jgi:hypothetical protein